MQLINQVSTYRKNNHPKSPIYTTLFLHCFNHLIHSLFTLTQFAYSTNGFQIHLPLLSNLCCHHSGPEAGNIQAFTIYISNICTHTHIIIVLFFSEEIKIALLDCCVGLKHQANSFSSAAFTPGKTKFLLFKYSILIFKAAETNVFCIVPVQYGYSEGSLRPQGESQNRSAARTIIV